MMESLNFSFEKAKNREIALGQSAYMRNQFPFLGIKKPLRAQLQKEFFSTLIIDSEDLLIKQVQFLIEENEREYHYAALDLLYFKKSLWTTRIFSYLRSWIETKSWWDTVDLLATKHLGHYLIKYPDEVIKLDQWIVDDNLWIRRSALIHQLKYKKNTDVDRLFRYCKLVMHEKEFFIQKAIGWALREYAKTNSKEVIDFVRTNRSFMHPLSIREALKHQV